MVTDFHSHILPCIDDGSASVEESIAMLRMEAEQGVRHVIATPHFYAHHDTPEHFLARRAEAQARLWEELRKHEGLPQITLGAEVYYFDGISNCDILPELAIGQTGHILIEMHNAPWSEAMYRELENIHAKHGLTPIIAHVDRYITPLRQHGIPERLSWMPVVVQANAKFFLRRSTRRLAMRLLRGNCIHLLGSDCHDPQVRAPNLEAAVSLIRKESGEDCLKRIKRHERQILGTE